MRREAIVRPRRSPCPSSRLGIEPGHSPIGVWWPGSNGQGPTRPTTLFHLGETELGCPPPLNPDTNLPKASMDAWFSTGAAPNSLSRRD